MYVATAPIELESGEILNALPCPFCAAVELGTTQHTLITNNDDVIGMEEVTQGWSVHCVTCGADGPLNGNEENAVTDWNTRYFYQDDKDAPWKLENRE